MRVQANRENPWVGIDLALEHGKGGSKPLDYLVGGLTLYGPHGDVIDLPGVGEAQKGTLSRGHPAGQIIEQPVMREFNAAPLQNLRRSARLAAAGAEPPANAFSGEPLKSGNRGANLRLFVVDLLQRPLEPAMTDEVPASLCGALGSRRVNIRALRVHPRRGPDAAPAQHIE